MVVFTIIDSDLLCAEQQVKLHEKGSSNAVINDRLNRTRAALNREYQLKSISTEKFVELSRRLNALWEPLES